MWTFKKMIYSLNQDVAEVVIEERQNVLLGYSDENSSSACANIGTPVTRYILLSQDWMSATDLFQYSTGTIPAIAGYYSDGVKWYYWDEYTFTSTGFC